MHLIHGRNLPDCWARAVSDLRDLGVRRDSRNGVVTLFPTPVTTRYDRPQERVLMDPVRDANPFFHLFEALWMLDGRRDVAFLQRFVKGFGRYSDDGETLHGAYGHRWRSHYGIDQLDTAINMLAQDPDTRRAVISMWDPGADLGVNSRDIPCNNLVYPWVDHEGALCMTVICRSNDMVWGAYGANAVHFSFLQEYIATSLNRPMGPLWQVSNNLHMYDGTAHQAEAARAILPTPASDHYLGEDVSPSLVPLMSVSKREWDEDLRLFMSDGPIVGFRDRFFRRVATPMWHAHQALQKSGLTPRERHEAALEILEQCTASDWRLAAQQWVQRRMQIDRVGGATT